MWDGTTNSRSRTPNHQAASKGIPMKVQFDPLSCEANGVCVGLVPDVFDLDENDHLHVVEEPPEHLTDQVRHAVRSCPKAALSVAE
jgi:ferredoxin